MVKKILVVDDEEDIRETIKTVLEKQKYVVRCAENGKKALVLIGEEKFDLIILDVMMPEMSGWDVSTEILKRHKEYAKKIMFLSVVEISEERKKELISKGIADYMTKPFDIKTLANKIKGLLK